MGNIWAHDARRMTAAEIDYDDRWGRVCGFSPKCQAMTAVVTSYKYQAGRGGTGRATVANKHVCADHADRFAAKHGITIADAPQQEPAPDSFLSAFVTFADALAPTPRWARVKPTFMSRQPWAITKHDRRTLVAGRTIYLTAAADLGFEAHVLPAAEQALAQQDRLVVTEPWTRGDNDTATAPVALAEDTPAWAGKPWTVVVDEAPRYSGGPLAWRAVLMLAPQFKEISVELGTHNMDVDRAIRTATTELAGSWTLGEWTRNEATATTTAQKAPAHAA
jgi:hypothetical protein